MGRKDRLPELTEAQLRIVEECWKRGSATVGEIWEALASDRALARNTVQTMVVRLAEKGWLVARRRGDRIAWSATVGREPTLRRMARRLADAAFGGSTSSLVMALLESRGVDAGQAERIRRMIAKAEDDAAGRGSP